MKSILVIYIVSFSFFVKSNESLGHLSRILPSEIENPINTNCRSALRICSGIEKETSYTQSFHFEGTSNCINGKTKLFYSFKAGMTVSNMGFNFSTSSSTSNYKIYGPFNSPDNSCEQVEQFIAPVVTQSASAALTHFITGSYIEGKYYVLEVEVNSCNGSITGKIPTGLMSCADELKCEDCIGSFQPSAGDYILSAWIKEDNGPSTQSVTTYTNSEIIVNAGLGQIVFLPKGQIIDGWQRVEGVFTSNTVGEIQIELKSLAGTSYFDDIRIFPYDGSMMSYVYDPITLRLMAELDERNYAKLYEYDEEGKLIRIKKETEKGIMTIQENRDNNSGQ